MTILKIKVVDASGADLAGQAVKVSGVDVLQTNSQGMAQFLLGEETPLDIAINGQSCWSGDTSVLARQEVFQQSSAGFTRVAGH